MTVSISQFWNLLAQSRLATPEQLQRLQGEFQQLKGAADGNVKLLVEWLISQNVISRYHSRVLLAGRAGPFFFGDYRVNDRVSAGRFEGAFRAVNGPSGHPVLLQFLSGPRAQSGAHWSSTVAKLLARSELRNRNLQRCFEPVDLSTHKFVVVEDLHGESLKERLANGRIPIPDACNVARHAAIALSYLHQSGQVHGDVRPRNIWIETSGHVKLLFDPVPEPRPEDEVERADYTAPELSQAGKAPDVLSDIYALGCTLYHAIAGQPPFAGGDVAQKMHRHATEAIEPLETYGAPPELANIVAFMMGKNPAVRHQSANASVDPLAAFVPPNLLNAPVPTPPATLGAYEQQIKHKQAQLMSGPAATSAAAAAAPISIRPADIPGASHSLSERVHPRATARKPNVGLFVGIGIAAAVGLILLISAMMIPKKEGEGGGGNGGEVAANNGGAAGGNGGGGAGGNGGGSAGGNGGSTGGGSSGGASTASGALPDDGRMLWASPTGGDPFDLRWTPPGGQIILVIRPSALMATAQGAQVVKALDASLGPSNESTRKAWESAAGSAFDEIERLIVSFHGNDGRYPRVSFVVTLAKAVAREELIKRWSATPNVSKVEGRDIIEANSYAYLPEDGAEVKTFAMGALEDIREAATLGGAAPSMRREMEILRKVSDAERHFTALFAPGFLFADGQELLTGPKRRTREALDWFFGDGLQAGMLSLQFGNLCYGEFRLVSEAGRDSVQLAGELKKRIAETPTHILDFVAKVYPPEYWRRVAIRLPQMAQFLHDQMRVGSEEKQALINFYLPGQAAPNLALAGSLLMQSVPSGSGAVATSPQGPRTIDELLQTKIDVSFGQKSLEFAMRDIANDLKETYPGMPFPFEIKLLGGDLEKDGITRNQQIADFAENQPVADVLTALVMKANPITTVKQPSETDQKLLWLIGSDPDDANRKIILITTRVAAAAKGYDLPAVFRPKGE